INGALTQADLLGIFGREGLDLATLFDTPYGDGVFTPNSPGAYAFRVYRNYDGAGSRFGETSVQAVSSDQGKLAIYGAQRTADGAVTLVIINKSGAAQTATLTVANGGGQTAQVYRYSAANLNAIAHLPNQSLAGNTLTASYPANSITLLVLANGNVPTATPTAPPTVTPTATVPPSPTPTGTATATSLNYVLSAVEITQGIQDLQNSVPLVRGKPAWVRAHVYRASGNSSPLVSAQLWRIVNGARTGNAVYPSNPGGKLAPAVSPSRDQLQDAFYFPVPADWLNGTTLQVEVEVNPQGFTNCTLPPPFCLFHWWRAADEKNYVDNTVRSALLNLQSVPPLRLQLYNVVYSKTVGNTTNWYKATDTQLAEIEDWLRRAYP
ncbi:MAG: hypothetical protein KDE31_14745, partial [Caldilineaceae bacterium]|nr:hypothetical protein [Caldilineaceae bacterium]